MKQIILKKISITSWILLLVLLWTRAIADTTSYYFYKPEIDYGSESLFNPVYTSIDGSYDILRNGAHTKNIFNQPYSAGFNNVMNNISRPIYHIGSSPNRVGKNIEIWTLDFRQCACQYFQT